MDSLKKYVSALLILITIIVKGQHNNARCVSYKCSDQYFNATLDENKDSILFTLKNNTDDTLWFYLGFFGGMDSTNKGNRYDVNLLLDKKIKPWGAATLTEQILPQQLIIRNIKLNREVYSYLHGFNFYNYYIGANSKKSYYHFSKLIKF